MRHTTILPFVVALFATGPVCAQFTLKNFSLTPEAARKCAEQGDADCQAKLGWFYENGVDGVKEDHALAIKWYRMAAEQGLIAAQMALATTYEGGYHVPKDYEEAAKWYLSAAERGDVDAQQKMAFLYWSGKGVAKDLVHAYLWANLAVAGQQNRDQYEINKVASGPGTPKEKEEVIGILKDSRQMPLKDFIEMRDDIEREMTARQIAEAQRLTREWKSTRGK